MSLDSFDRNYGMTGNSREYFMGNNGFVTVVVKLPADVEIGATVVPQDNTDAAQTALSAALRNQSKIHQLLQNRGVMMATSQLSGIVDPTVSGFETVAGNTIAFGKSGTLSVGSFGITYMVERQDVYTAQIGKPGSTYALNVEPCAEIAAVIAGAGFFQKKDGTPALASSGVAVKVFAALPVIL